MKKYTKDQLLKRRWGFFDATSITYQEILFLVSILGVSIFFKYKLITITIIKGKQYFPPTIHQTALHLTLITPDIQEMVLMVLGTISFLAAWRASGQGEKVLDEKIKLLLSGHLNSKLCILPPSLWFYSPGHPFKRPWWLCYFNSSACLPEV